MKQYNGLKVCSCCNEIKPLPEFYISKSQVNRRGNKGLMG